MQLNNHGFKYKIPIINSNIKVGSDEEVFSRYIHTGIELKKINFNGNIINEEGFKLKNCNGMIYVI